MNKQYRIIFRKAGDFMAFDTRELFARLLKCESGGEGLKVCVRLPLWLSTGQLFLTGICTDKQRRRCAGNHYTAKSVYLLKDFRRGQYNSQNVYNIVPEDIHYEIADWALAGNTDSSVGNSLFYFNPYSSTCPNYFPTNIGVIYNRIGKHCFYSPTQAYKNT